MLWSNFFGNIFFCFTLINCASTYDYETKCSSGPSQKHSSDSKFTYPMTGTWFRDSASGKYYFKQGNSIYVQRNDGYYSKWVSSGRDDFAQNDRYKWTWDREGRLYPLPDNCSPNIRDNQKFGIPIKCLGGQCPQQIRYPSGGVWHYTNCKYYYEIGDTKYELAPNGFYKKWSLRQPGPFLVQICPDYWTWDTRTGKWEAKRGSESRMCTYNDPPCPPRHMRMESERMVVPPISAFNL